MKINIGSGLRRIDGYVNIDDDPLVNPEYLINLDDVNIKLPFDDSTVEAVHAHHILEHIGDGFIPLMQELYRVCQHGAIIDIEAPHHFHEVYYADPTHKRPITLNGMRLFSKKYNQENIDRFGASSGIGIKYDVNFEVVWYDYRYDDFYKPMIDNYNNRKAQNQITPEEDFMITRLFREATNVATDVMMKLVVVKE